MTDIEKEREAFEAWARPQGYACIQDDAGYKSVTQYAWNAWLARARSERVVSVGELEALCDEWEAEVRLRSYTEARPLLEELRTLIAKAGVGDE